MGQTRINVVRYDISGGANFTECRRIVELQSKRRCNGGKFFCSFAVDRTAAPRPGELARCRNTGWS